MAEKYGISSLVLTGDASSAVAVDTCVVFIGRAEGSIANAGTAIKCTSVDDYNTKFHDGAAAETPATLDLCAEYALNRIASAWFVNVNKNLQKQSAADYTDCIEKALADICLDTSDIPNLLCVPEMQDATVLTLLDKQCSGNIAGQYHAQCVVDCAESADQIDNSNKPVAKAITVPKASGNFLSCWGRITEDGEKYFHGSIVATTQRALQDAKNTQGIPYRSVGNLRVDCKGMAIVVKGDQATATVPCSCMQNDMNEVVENGIISFVNKGNNRWYTWGDHTSAVTAGKVDDETYRFDSTVAVLYTILNRFIVKWESEIDSPMTLRLRDTIINDQQDYLNGLVAAGALIGTPKCEFRAVDNDSDTLGKGQFYFTDIVTATIPAKYLQLNIQYTDEGLSAYLEE